MCGQLRFRTVQLLLGDLSVSQDLEKSGDWTSVLRLCAQWNAVPLLLKRVAESGARLPESCAPWPGKLSMAALLQTGRCLKSGVDALSLLAGHGIPCAGFKGLASIAYLYGGGSGERSLRDVDILIQPCDAKPAVEALLANGFRLSIECPLDDYIDFVRRSPGSAGNEAVSLLNEKGGGVDLHWRLGGMSVLPLLKESQTVKVLNRSVPLVSRRHSLILTAHHALRNHFLVDLMVRDLLDFDAWRRHFQSNHGAEMLALAGDSNLAVPLLALEKIASLTRDVSPDWLTPHAGEKDCARAEDLVELYSHQLESGALNKDLVYLASPASLWQFGATIVNDWGRFRSTMVKMDDSFGAPETLAERLGKLLKAVPRFPVKRWRQLRTLASAKRLMIMGE